MGHMCCGTGSDQHLIEKMVQTSTLLEEVDFILSTLHRQPIEKALNPFRQRDFLRLEARLVKDLRRAYGSAANDEVAALGKLIEAVDPRNPATLEEFVRASKTLLRGLERQVAAEVGPVMEEAIMDMYRMSKIAMTNQLYNQKRISSRGEISAFGGRDEHAVEVLQRNQHIYVQQGVRNKIEDFDERARAVLSDAVERNLSRKAVSDELYRAFGNTVDDERYWNIVGSAWMNKTRNVSALEAFDEVGIEEYQILAVMDERTSAICRALNGTIYSVKVQIDIERRAAASDDLDALTKITPWLSTRQDKDGNTTIGVKQPSGRFSAVAVNGDFTKDPKKLQEMGFALPPFHGLCRTTIVEV